MKSNCFREGLNSKIYDTKNPYPEDSDEFNDYEAGRNQKIKRLSTEEIARLDALDRIEEEREAEEKSVKSSVRDILLQKNSYKNIRG